MSKDIKTSGTDVSRMKNAYRTAVPNDFPDEWSIPFAKESDLRYGENPSQIAAIYRQRTSHLAEITNIRLAKSGKQGLSATNYMDITRGMDILKYFNRPSAAVMKHAVPSGFATTPLDSPYDSMSSVYRKARDADARSAFGSVVVFNKLMDKETASAVLETFVECVAAPDYDEGVLDLLESKKDLRAAVYSDLHKIPKFIEDDVNGLHDIRTLPTGRCLIQGTYLSSIKDMKDIILDPMIDNVFVNRMPSDKEIDDMLTSWRINFAARSNGIVFVKDGVTLSIGAGEQERIGAVEKAIVKAYHKDADRKGIAYNPLFGIVELIDNLKTLEGAVASSDGFVPFSDTIDLMARVGVAGLIQPGGSIKDGKVIESINKHNMFMGFTRERCFSHFDNYE